jgi:fermentation-respiration switch protein FrsA (DUF1100 family)
VNQRFVFFAVLFALTMLAAGWWIGRHTFPREQPTINTHPKSRVPDPKAEQVIDDANVVELEAKLKLAMRDLAEQRQIIRKHSLTKSVRSIDELLALFPAKYPQGDWTPSETIFEDCWFETLDGLRIHGWYLKQDTPQAVILYAHGNAGNITHRAHLAVHLQQRFNVSVLLFDYRGYGRSEGVPTIDGLHLDARAARDYLAQREQIQSRDVVLMGRSLGGAIMVELAAEDGARGLVLESAFSSLRDVAGSHYPKFLVNLLVADRLDSHSSIARFDGPLLISHGTADQTIPFVQGRKLFDAAKEPKTFVQIANADHNDPQSEEYYDHFGRFLADLPNL